MQAPNDSTHRLETWLVNDGRYVYTAQSYAAADPSGDALRNYVEGLLCDFSNEGRPILNGGDRHLLRTVRDQVTLEDVRWLWLADAVCVVQ